MYYSKTLEKLVTAFIAELVGVSGVFFLAFLLLDRQVIFRLVGNGILISLYTQTERLTVKLTLRLIDMNMREREND